MFYNLGTVHVYYDFLVTVKAATRECVIRTGQSLDIGKT